MISMNDAGRQWLSAHQPIRHGPQCSFVDSACARPALGYLCGGLTTALWKRFTPASLEDVPAWIIYSSWDTPYIPTQQLSLFDPPSVLWRRRNGNLSEKRSWWAAVYYCNIGRDFALSNEKDMGARHLRCEVVRKKPGCKRKRIAAEHLFCK